MQYTVNWRQQKPQTHRLKSPVSLFITKLRNSTLNLETSSTLNSPIWYPIAATPKHQHDQDETTHNSHTNRFCILLFDTLCGKNLTNLIKYIDTHVADEWENDSGCNRVLLFARRDATQIGTTWLCSPFFVHTWWKLLERLSRLSIGLGLQLGEERSLAVVHLAVTLGVRQTLGGPALLHAALGDLLGVGGIGADGSVRLLVDALQLW